VWWNSHQINHNIQLKFLYIELKIIYCTFVKYE